MTTPTFTPSASEMRRDTGQNHDMFFSLSPTLVGRVPSPGLIPAAPHTSVLDGVCKARSSPLVGWPDGRSALLNRGVG
jgi:hypothetical protein